MFTILFNNENILNEPEHEEGELYKIGFKSSGALASTTKKNIGTLFF
jgi:hypothetical protein